MVLAVNNLTGFGGGGPERSVTFLQETVDGNALSTYTFSSVNLGSPATNRTIVVGVAVSSGGTPTSATVTIGGVSATVVGTISDADMVDSMSLIAYATVATGTSGDVEVVVDATCRVCRIYTYRVIATSFSVSNLYTDNGASLSQSVSVSSGGSAIAVSACASSVATATWTGAAEQADSTGDEAGSSALLESTATSPVTISCSWSAGNARTMSIISFAYD